MGKKILFDMLSIEKSKFHLERFERKKKKLFPNVQLCKSAVKQFAE